MYVLVRHIIGGYICFHDVILNIFSAFQQVLIYLETNLSAKIIKWSVSFMFGTTGSNNICSTLTTGKECENAVCEWF